MYLLIKNKKEIQMKKIAIISLILVMMTGGCFLFEPKSVSNLPDYNTAQDVSKAQDSIGKVSKNVNSATKDINKENKTIREETYKTRDKIPNGMINTINPHLSNIEQSSNVIDTKTSEINKYIAQLSEAQSLLQNAEEKIKNMENIINTLTKERDKAKEERDQAIADKNSQLHKMINWIIVGCMTLTVIFTVAFFFYGNRIGLMGAVTCGLLCLVAIFIETFFIYVAIAGGFIMVFLACALIYNVIIDKKAFKEMVETVEISQDNMDEDVKKNIFGGRGETGIMDTIQSKSTMNKVKREKQKMNKLWNYAKYRRHS
jgi:hypothetical protein